MVLIAVTVTAKTTEASGICSFELRDAEGRDLPPFEAGAHIDVHLPGGFVRQYSLCNAPGERHRYLIGVLRDPKTRGGSAALHDLVREGDRLTISAPRNHFPLVESARRSLLFAGGIGVTPLLCMAEQLALADGDFVMHYCARSSDRAAFLDRIGRSAFADRVQLNFDDLAPDRQFDLAAALGAPVEGAHVYVCGPAGYIQAVLDHARSAGWSEAQLHCEYFAASTQPQDNDGSFEVRIASSNEVFIVPPDRSIVDVLATAGYDIETSCGSGVCGTCMTHVLEGEPDHRDVYLTPALQATNSVMMLCCSRAKSSMLTLDL
jgi:vanillate O-demethylase ferredoxin subunit